MTYPHKDIVRAYLDGKAIEWFDTRKNKWVLLYTEGDVDVSKNRQCAPSFWNDSKYRVVSEKVEYAVIKHGKGQVLPRLMLANEVSDIWMGWEDTGERVWL